MSKLGRPRVDNPRDIQYRLRMNREEADLMEEASALSGMSVSDTIREAVRRMAAEEREKREQAEKMNDYRCDRRMCPRYADCDMRGIDTDECGYNFGF